MYPHLSVNENRWNKYQHYPWRNIKIVAVIWRQIPHHVGKRVFCHSLHSSGDRWDFYSAAGKFCRVSELSSFYVTAVVLLNVDSKHVSEPQVISLRQLWQTHGIISTAKVLLPFSKGKNRKSVMQDFMNQWSQFGFASRICFDIFPGNWRLCWSCDSLWRLLNHTSTQQTG